MTSANRCRRRWRTSRSSPTCSSATTKVLSSCWCSCPRSPSVAQTLVASAPGSVLMNLNLSINNPPPCLTGFLPASQWRSARGHQHGAVAVRNVLQDPARHSGQRGARCPQLSVCRCPRQARGDATRVPRQQAVRPAGHQPVVRRSESAAELPGAGCSLRSTGRPGQGDTGAVDQQRPQPRTGRSVARPTPAGRRSAAAARIGHRAVQRAAAQPVYLHAGKPDGHLRAIQRRSRGPDGSKYTLEDSRHTGRHGWKDMLAPAG